MFAADVDFAHVEPQPPRHQFPRENCRPLDLVNSVLVVLHLIFQGHHTSMDNIARMKVIKAPKYLSGDLLDDWDR